MTGLRYKGDGTLHDHVDHTGEYLVLLSLGCTVDFCVDGQVVTMKSGDALVLNGGTAHNVMHGVRKVHPGTCPPGLPKALLAARISVQLRQISRTGLGMFGLLGAGLGGF